MYMAMSAAFINLKSSSDRRVCAAIPMLAVTSRAADSLRLGRQMRVELAELPPLNYFDINSSRASASRVPSGVLPRWREAGRRAVDSCRSPSHKMDQGETPTSLP